jgi:peptidoglycan/xylan/chitin deacetylase (PgdA/CDA1 family)
MTTVPNTCRADGTVPYMTWAETSSLRTTYGWELGAHTVTHPLLASTDPDDQPTKLTTAQVDAELANLLFKPTLALHQPLLLAHLVTGCHLL